jgi:Na+/melibiose symporter-like transporter
MAGARSPNRLSLTVLCAFGSLSLPLSIVGLPLAIYLAPFYADDLHIPLATLGLAMLVGRFSDIVTDPLIGIASDMWRPKIGRRKVWIPIGVSVLMLGVWKLFNPESGAGFVYFIIWLTVVYLGFTMTTLPYQAWGGELLNSYEARTRISSTLQFFGMAGLIVSTLIPALVLMSPHATSGDVLAALSIAMVILLPLCAVAVMVYVPEPKLHTSAPYLSLKKAYRQLRRNGPFKRVAIVVLIGYVAETFRITITIFFARDVIGVHNVGVIYVYYFITALVSVPFWSWFANRIGKHRALAWGFVVVVVTDFSLFLLPHGAVALFTAIFVAKGFCFGALQLLPYAMIADTADVDTVMSGDRRQGLFFAIMNMVSKFGQAIGQGVSLNLLAFVGYRATGGNGQNAIFWLQALYALVPGIIMAPTIWLIWKYPLTAVRHRRFQLYIENRNIATSSPSD